MEILSKDTLQLVRDEKFRSAVHDVLREDKPGVERTVTVRLPKENRDTEVTVRRVGA